MQGAGAGAGARAGAGSRSSSRRSRTSTGSTWECQRRPGPSRKHQASCASVFRLCVLRLHLRSEFCVSVLAFRGLRFRVCLRFETRLRFAYDCEMAFRVHAFETQFVYFNISVWGCFRLVLGGAPKVLPARVLICAPWCARPPVVTTGASAICNAAQCRTGA